MPGLEEVLYYLHGILALIRGKPAGWKHFDLSPNGVSRSFWAIGWSLPGMLVSWISWRGSYLQYGGGGDTGVLFFFRISMLDMTVWMLQILIAAMLLIYLKQGRHFNAMVVGTNWLAVPFSLYSGLLAALQMFFPGAMVLWWLLINIELAAAVYATYSIFRMMSGVKTGQAIWLAVATLLTSLIITPVLQDFLGLSIY